MNLHKLSVSMLVALAAGLGACASSGPKKVNDLVGAIEHVYVNSELSKDALNGALDSLLVIVRPEFKGDAVIAYQKFMEHVEVSEAQSEKLRESIERMEKTAAPVFKEWGLKLEAFTHPKMRERSQARLAATRNRYNKVVAAVELVRADYRSFNGLLRDHSLFLGHDLNPASLAEIRDDVLGLKKRARELDSRFNACLVAARNYVDAAALPGPGSLEEETLESDSRRASVAKVGGKQKN